MNTTATPEFVLSTATLEIILAAVHRNTAPINASEAIGELTRRIDKRAAAGKHPMVHVVKARADLLELIA